MGILIIRRTLTYGSRHGVATGLGIASADGTYALLAAFGITAISQLLIDHSTLIRVIGGAFLLLIGFSTLRSNLRALPPPDATAPVAATDLIGAFASAFALAVTNPITILVFTGIFAGIAATTASACPVGLTGGVFSGSLVWWLLLITLVSLARGRVTPRVLRAINLASGVGIALFGVWVLLGS